MMPYLGTSARERLGTVISLALLLWGCAVLVLSRLIALPIVLAIILPTVFIHKIFELGFTPVLGFVASIAAVYVGTKIMSNTARRTCLVICSFGILYAAFALYRFHFIAMYLFYEADLYRDFGFYVDSIILGVGGIIIFPIALLYLLLQPRSEFSEAAIAASMQLPSITQLTYQPAVKFDLDNMLHDIPNAIRKFFQSLAARDFLRLGTGSVLVLRGCYSTMVTLYFLFEAMVDYGPSNYYLPELLLGYLGPMLLATAALVAGFGIILRWARYTSAILCFGGILGEAFTLFYAQIHAPYPQYMTIHGIYFLLFFAGFLSIPAAAKEDSRLSRSADRPLALNDSNWREWLLASLRDTGVEAPQDRFRQGALAALGYVATALAIVVVGKLVLPPALTIVWIIFAIAVLARLRNFFLRRLWQAHARSAEKELQRPSSRHPVLYLRSFTLDAQIAAPTLIERFLGTVPLASAEQIVTKQLRICGPVIAIGRPGEALPPLGAARFYVSHERWKEKVADVVRVAELVVWATGTTEGLRWEISHLIETLPLNKLVLWAHPHLLRVSEGEREAEWTTFRELLGGLFPHQLPERLGNARFFYFTAQGEPIPVAPTGIGNPQRSALRALLRAKGYPKPDPVAEARMRRRWIIAGATAASFWFVINGAVVAADHLHEQEEQARRDGMALNDLAYKMIEYRPGREADIDAYITGGARNLSPFVREQVVSLAKHYVQIFAVAPQHPDVELLLYNVNSSLLMGVDTSDDAKKRKVDADSVLAAFAEFEREWTRARSSWKKTPLQITRDNFDKLTNARVEFLTNEAALLQFVIGHPAGWKLVKDQSGISLPAYEDQTLEQDLTKIMAARGGAAAALRPLLKDDGLDGDLSASYKDVGDAQKDHDELAGALKSYRHSLAIAVRLAQSDPSNAGWQRDVWVSYNKIVEVLKAQGDLAGELKVYYDGVAVIERLAQSDPSNAGWLRGLSTLYDNVGYMLKAQGDLAGALKSYRDSLAVAERLAQSDPTNVGWQRDLSLSYDNVGNAQKAQGDLPGALKSYRDSLAIAEQLAQSDPTNVRWQRDLSVSYDNVGDVQMAQGDLDHAIADYAQAIRLDPSKGGSSVIGGGYLARGDAYKVKGDLDHAIADYSEAIQLNPQYALAYDNRGDAYKAKGDLDHAIADYSEAITLTPDSAVYRDDRGNAYYDEDDYDRAIADYDAAIQLDPKNYGAYFSRGRADLYSGALPKALVDLNQATELNPKYAYTALWLDIANRRSNLPSRLPEAIKQIDMTKWPAPIIRLYLGQLTPEAALATADDPDVNTKKGQVCEVNFYSGELALQDGNKNEATRLFRLSAADCPKTFIEYDGAKAELKALGATP